MSFRKKIPIGVSDFKSIITENYYYVDKSMLVKEIIEDGSEVILLPRPRRFGKTLNLSMLRYFFDVNETVNLFEGLKVWQNHEYRAERGKYPVVFITFKDVKNDSFASCMRKIRDLISTEIRRLNYLFNSKKIEQNDLLELKSLAENTSEDVEFESALLLLSRCLEAHHGQKALILIDEYDMPIQSGYVNDFCDKMTGFMHNFLSAAFKDNLHLYKGVITGILRISKESIFSGLNNPKVSTILDVSPYSDKFGLLEDEVSDLLQFYGVKSSMDIVRKWYNGYTFGKDTIYNPWSIINFVDSQEEVPKPFWANTSSNDLIERLLTLSDSDTKMDFEELIKGGSIQKEIDSNIVMQDLTNNSSNIWSLLLFCGYLKPVSSVFANRKVTYSLKIPNEEVLSLFENIVNKWFIQNIPSSETKIMLTCLINGDISTFAKILDKFVINSMSYFDPAGKEAEKVYHAFILGLMVALSDKYDVSSNRESGYGRYDVCLIPKDTAMRGIIFEFKRVDHYDNETMESAAESALNQIDEMKYAANLRERNINLITAVAIVFDGKKLLVKHKEI